MLLNGKDQNYFDHPFDLEISINNLHIQYLYKPIFTYLPKRVAYNVKLFSSVIAINSFIH